ncbi:UNVERIFIED_CONTAM: hypothetical protein Sangu_0559700 [Sesamum angustifolium]|uniref:Uncharacterized protein n=1 Tax=Sesamum angustifolium TaxID=2727405 RepID=A0AAW2QAJ3_9LAMI
MSVLLQRLKWIINGFNKSPSFTPKRLDGPDVKPSHQLNFDQLEKQQAVKPNSLKPNREIFKQPMLEAAHEISIYIHRFHNLDLFQQGWYQLKITMRWRTTILVP